jgi:DNA-cytosine methyltransferase
MKVLSLFDGMSCGQIALDQLGIPVEKYYASEIDKYAIKVTQANYPNTIQVGDVCNLNAEDYKDVDLIQAGSPCQGFSFAGKQLAFDDPRSALFFEFIRLLKAIKPKYFLLENVRMKKEFLQVISQQVSECYPEIPFGIEPIFINSSLVSAQSRQRYYWTNIPGIKQPEDRGIVLRDILEDNFDSERDKAHCIDANYYKGASVEQYKKKHRRQLVNRPKQVGVAVDINGHDVLKRVYSPDGKSPTVNTCQGGNREPKVVTGGAFRGRAYDNKGKRMDRDGSSVANKTTQMLELRKDDKSNAITTVGKDSVVVEESKLREKSKTVRSGGRGSYDRHEWDSVDELHWRKLTPLECERLQTVPDNYTNHVSNTQRYKMLGNGWTVEVIKHILQNMEYENDSKS